MAVPNNSRDEIVLANDYNDGMVSWDEKIFIGKGYG